MPARLALLAALAAGAAAPAARADVKPHPLFTDHVVLQQGVEVPVWGTADPGEKVAVTLAGPAGPAGVVEAEARPDGKWAVKLPTLPAGTGYTLTVRGKNEVVLKDVAVGEVWVCSGQSNMEWPVNAAYDADKVKAGAKNPNVRLFTVQRRVAPAPLADPADLKHLSGWAECGPDTVGRFSAVAYHFGAHLQKHRNVPVGLIHTSWGGTPAEAWTSAEALAAVPGLKYLADRARAGADGKAKPNQNSPSALYNGMLHPLLPFAVKGAIWYQGESNAGRAAEYRALFPAMIRDWRAKWGSEFPFLAVQLAPFISGDADGVTWPELREAQNLAAKELPKVGVAVITDAGDLFDIHPRDKATPGTRLALLARAIAYGEPVVATGPAYKELAVDGDKAVVTFDGVGGGLVGRYGPGPKDLREGPINGFEACGDDKVFHPAKARIKGNTVVVASDAVKAPVAVRYGWRNYPVCNLFNKDGLPASPFRTDDFPLTTAAKKDAKK